ncbi:hypothetical protein AAFF_G00261880 [Aldrovandia affinis]|uniref:EF-hand domain-containing protein n=1 Tax=Aldrovandia affinis TaxID=143900 RepID=A0AAD7REE4_9TELE|nr:hypothetical protein AAFF_G00261880 [Aldrovandia affinis]
MMAIVPQNLGPQCRAMAVTPRPQGTPKPQATTRSPPGHESPGASGRGSRQSDCTSSVRSVPNEALSAAQVERALVRGVQEKLGDLRAAFQALDTEGNATVTKGEFRRVIESFVLPLTTVQFAAVLAKAPRRDNGSVAYAKFLKRCCRTSSAKNRFPPRSSQHPMTLGEIQRCLKDKIGSNLKNVTRAFRLFDHNGDGKIQKHELLRVLESYCPPLSNQDFNRIWSHCCLDKSGMMSYRVFLQRLGVDCENHGRSESQDSVKSALNWDAVSHDNERRQQGARTDAAPALPSPGLTADQIHVVFLDKMRSNCGHIRRALQAFDVTHGGFVSPEDLKSVLTHFLFPMSDLIFQDLASRFGLKISEPVPWAKFMAQFEDLAQGRARLHLSAQQRLKTLQEIYPLLKSSFLMLDQGGGGRVTRAELRRVMEGRRFRLTERQLKELMILLDPEHTGVIHDQRFLELLPPRAGNPVEMRECSGDTQQAPQSNRGAAETQAWSTVEALLQDKLSEQLDSVMEALRSYDCSQNGTVQQHELREVIQRYGLPVSDSHFHRLCKPWIDSGRVVYGGFLNSLGMSKRRDETESTTRAQSPNKRFSLHSVKSRAVEDKVLRKLRENLALRSIAMHNCLLTTGGNPGGTLSSKHFRKILEDSGIILDQGEFDILVEALGFKDGNLSHADFLVKYDKLKQETGAEDNNCVNGKQSSLMTAEDCLCQLRQRIEEHHRDILTAFLLMDKNRDGVINRCDFRALYDSLRFVTMETEYQRMLDLLGLEPGATLNYAEFFNTVQATSKPGPQPRSPSRSKWFEEEAGEQVHSHLVTRARSGWSEMAKAFSHFNEDGQGLVFKRELRQLLYMYALPITPNEFEKLWLRYDDKAKGVLTHSEFLEKLGVAAEGCGRGQSHMIGEERSDSQSQGRVDSVSSQAQTKAILQDIGELVRENYTEFSCSLVRLDENKDSLVRLEELLALLHKHGRQVEEAQLVNLLDSLKISMDDRKLSYLHFLRALERRAPPGPRPEPLPQTESVEQLSSDRAMHRVREAVTQSYHTLHKVFSAFDRGGTGAVSALEFRRVLEHFCVRLSDRQFTHLLAELPVSEEDHSVPWKHFLLHFHLNYQEVRAQCNPTTLNTQVQTAADWLEKVERAAGPAKSRPLPMSGILERIQEVVCAKIYTVAMEMANLDYGHINVISMENFRMICDRHFLRLTNEQFESLWKLLPVNEFGNLEYREFLKRFSGESRGEPQSSERGQPVTSERGQPVTSPGRMEGPPSALRRPKTAPCTIGRAKSADQEEQTGRHSVVGGGAAPLQNCDALDRTVRSCDSVERRVHSQIRGCWRELQRRCREEDVAGDGGISTDSFLAILQDLRVKMARAELEQLAVKYGIAVNGRVSYPDFLRRLVLSLQPRPATAFDRPKVPLPRTPMSVGVLTGQCADSLLGMFGSVQRFWRPMRQSFIAFDRNRTGLISFGNFRQVLRQYGINLSHDEAFHLSSYLDKNLSGKISYNDFLYSFLQ